MKAKNKGNRGELEWRDILNKKFGVKYARTPLSGGLDFKGDVSRMYGSKKSIIDGYHWEIKRVEKLNIHKAFEQARKDKRDKTPVVAFRRNLGNWMICLDADDFLNLLKILEEHNEDKTG